MKKGFILFLYAIALYIVLKNWYRQGNTGIPNPAVIGAPTYLYAILGLASDFTGGFTVPLAAGLTMALAWQNTGQNAISKAAKNATNKAPASGLTGPTPNKAPASGLTGPTVVSSVKSAFNHR